MNLIAGLLKGFAALPYRARFERLGRGVYLRPPLLLSGARRVRLGDRVVVEHFAGLSTSEGGSIDIGDDCELRCFCRIEAHSGAIRLGPRSSVNPFVLISGYGGVKVGSDVRIGAHSALLSSTHVFDDVETTIREQGVARQPLVIGDDVWIGHACTLLGGIRVGDGAVIAAGAVVTQDVPRGAVVGGVPATVLKQRYRVDLQ